LSLLYAISDTIGQDAMNVGNFDAKGDFYGKKMKDFHASTWISFGL